MSGKTNAELLERLERTGDLQCCVEDLIDLARRHDVAIERLAVLLSAGAPAKPAPKAEGFDEWWHGDRGGFRGNGRDAEIAWHASAAAERERIARMFDRYEDEDEWRGVAAAIRESKP